jgi:hypothetical protein
MNSLMLLQFHELSTTQTDSADTKRDDKKKKKKTLIPENSGTKLTVISNWKFLQESTRNFYATVLIVKIRKSFLGTEVSTKTISLALHIRQNRRSQQRILTQILDLLQYRPII